MTTTHNLGFPRIGAQRELKWALEAYWRGESDRADLLRTGAELRKRHWRLQAGGLNWVPVGDFSLYDHVLDHSVMLGCVPKRFGAQDGPVDLDTYLRMARGRSAKGEAVDACEMTKWFDTNYHYIVPEFEPGQRFRLASEHLFEQVAEAQALGVAVKPVLLGPLSFLWLGKCVGEDFDKLELLDGLLAVYGEIIARLGAMGIEWVQIDEPILVLDLPAPWLQALESAYNRLRSRAPRILLATYFGELRDKLSQVCTLPVEGLHLDGVRGPEQLLPALDMLGGYKVLSVGLIDGRNVWRTDLAAALEVLEPIRQRLGERLWLAPSCSLLHVPVDLDFEPGMDDELKSWLAFARQKLDELALLRQVLLDPERRASKAFVDHQASVQARHDSRRIHREEVRDRLKNLQDAAPRRATPYAERALVQHARLRLPEYPTTTIGSFPQTAEIRRARRRFKDGTIDEAEYERHMRAAVAEAVRHQEAVGLDVLVHGEPERNDMVEYFGGLLEGFAISGNAWVQSYGSRCVKPPIVYGDVARPAPMTLDWITYAQSLTDKPMKAMLTGPVTILQWSFVRDDQPRVATCRQIALALRDEIDDLERAGIAIIQVDEPALREGLPLRRGQWQTFLADAVGCFRLATAGAADDTQIHTHMCYSRFNDIIHAIADMDADVITIETARSNMTLLDAFVDFDYPNEIGPGVYDIHSPNTPEVARMVELLERAAARIAPGRLWVNPDCGLKTREWPEVEAALTRMVRAAAVLRSGSERAGAA